jgi:hypothetical protein
VGLAIGTGTDIAVESADVVLMSGNLQGVPNAIALSKATIGNIRQNLFWAFAYNTALIRWRLACCTRIRCAAVADLRGRRDGAVQRVRARQRAAPAPLPAAAGGGYRSLRKEEHHEHR